MIFRSFAVMGALMVLSATAHAGSPPKELYGKSVAVAWTETRSLRFESDQQVRYVTRSHQMNIYISSVGRPFVRLISTGVGAFNLHQLGNPGYRSSLTEAAPGEAAAEHVDFEGRSIVVYRQFRSGARRIAIHVDGTACKATIVNGREGGKNIQSSGDQGHGGVESLSIQVGSVSCSIREGNVFGQ
jgi:hypothetical protein